MLRYIVLALLILCFSCAPRRGKIDVCESKAPGDTILATEITTPLETVFIAGIETVRVAETSPVVTKVDTVEVLTEPVTETPVEQPEKPEDSVEIKVVAETQRKAACYRNFRRRIQNPNGSFLCPGKC